MSFAGPVYAIIAKIYKNNLLCILLHPKEEKNRKFEKDDIIFLRLLKSVRMLPDIF